MKQKRNHIFGFVAGFLCMTVLDQWTKHLAASSLKGKTPYVIWEGVFELFYSENRGAAFGMLQGKQFFFFFVALCVLVVIVYVMVKLPADSYYIPLEICLTGIASGAVGNLIDRVSQGYVVDFLYFKLINFPIFNVADCYVTVATAVLMFLFLWYYKDEDLEMLIPHGKGEIPQ